MQEKLEYLESQLRQLLQWKQDSLVNMEHLTKKVSGNYILTVDLPDNMKSEILPLVDQRVIFILLLV